MVKVKRNQKKLLQTITQLTQSKRTKDTYTETEKNRGRKEKRVIKTYSAPRSLRATWTKARTIIYVNRLTHRNGKETSTESYYLSSLNLSAAKLGIGIRSHWAIENQLHYVKDVVTKEDNIKVQNDNAAAVFSLFRNTTINAYRMNGYKSVKNAIRSYGGNLPLLLKFIE